MAAWFEEGMNDLPPVTKMPPNVAHLMQTNDGQPVAPYVAELHASNFAFDIDCPLCSDLHRLAAEKR